MRSLTVRIQRTDDERNNYSTDCNFVDRFNGKPVNINKMARTQAYWHLWILRQTNIIEVGNPTEGLWISLLAK